jgi:hypothetical protein
MAMTEKQGDTSASGPPKPRFEERVGKAGSALSGALGAGFKGAAAAFKGVTTGEVVDLAGRAVKRAGAFVDELVGEAKKDLPTQRAMARLNDFCAKNHCSSPMYQAVKDTATSHPCVLYVVSIATIDAEHKVHQSKLCVAQSLRAGIEEAAADLLAQLSA